LNARLKSLDLAEAGEALAVYGGPIRESRSVEALDLVDASVGA
jgi:hypothetical protein